MRRLIIASLLLLVACGDKQETVNQAQVITRPIFIQEREVQSMLSITSTKNPKTTKT